MSYERKRAGTIPITKDNKLVLISSIKKGDYVFPKGGIELSLNESAKIAAERETLEEAGVKGVIEDNSFYTDSYGIKWFILRVNEILDVWDENHKRKRIFVDVSDLTEENVMPKIKLRNNVLETVKAAVKLNKI
ncbi:Nudix hydrolase 17, mitochondrial [Astathelohania contejeani]|uniref:Nudix hydrolase 17, mitochondrial n=1 Tax=Astathelohania contejeani TaxID=164912 RepID=A0ABQ7I0M2_9MICR|nr:Nudix hydrolase 17, mitochondrial [Thelohania contejeani]